MTLTQQVTQNIVLRLLKGEDYRIEIVALINAEFLQFAIDFFTKVAVAKLNNKDIVDWYQKEFLKSGLPVEDIAVNSGLNMKTITNMYNSAKKEVVIEAASNHYSVLYDSIAALVENNNDIDLTLTIKLNGVSVELNISESLIVINTLAVKRAALRGGAYSTAGKQVEKMLMLTLCKLYKVPETNYKLFLSGTQKLANAADFEREIDFFFIDGKLQYNCEVKLMGKGNPESADAVIARDSKIFVADKLSDTNKTQLDSLKVEWVELRSKDGFRKIAQVFTSLNIPHTEFNGNIEKELPSIFKEIFK